MCNKGFTLIEMLLVVALIALLGLVSVPVYMTVQNRNDLDLQKSILVQSLRRAEVLSSSMKEDSAWGVYIDGSKMVIFKGSSYSFRDSAFDEEFLIPASVSVEGIKEVVFEKLTGEPNPTGDITLISNINESRIISINEKGSINY